MPFTNEDRAVLRLARATGTRRTGSRWRGSGSSLARSHSGPRANTLLDSPAAEFAEPAIVHRLQRLRDVQRRIRHGGRGHVADASRARRLQGDTVHRPRRHVLTIMVSTTSTRPTGTWDQRPKSFSTLMATLRTPDIDSSPGASQQRSQTRSPPDRPRGLSHVSTTYGLPGKAIWPTYWDQPADRRPNLRVQARVHVSEISQRSEMVEHLRLRHP